MHPCRKCGKKRLLQNEEFFLTMAFWMLAAPAALWLVILMLPWRPWACREVLEADEDIREPDLSDIAVLVPARNEEKTIGPVLRGLMRQGKGLAIVMIDDESTDGTRNIACSVSSRITIVNGTPPPPGWTGKLWALEQGRMHAHTRLTMLLDADIELRPGTLWAMLKKMRRHDLSMLSLMAAPNMAGTWEQLLMPAFIYFFKMVYPFSLSNRPGTGVAAAAGGCMLLESRILDEIGGFAVIRSAIIDDCALASHIKAAGHPIWIGLTHAAVSLRSGGLADIGNMIARTAFTQLRYSFFALLGCSVMLLAAYGLPVGGLFFSGWAFTLSLAVLLAMIASYLPVLRFYGRSFLWAPAMPLIATYYLMMTWVSAARYRKGERSRWKGRSYPALFTNTAASLPVSLSLSVPSRADRDNYHADS